MLKGATTRRVHWKVADGRPELSCTVAMISTLPGVVRMPASVMVFETRLGEGASGPVKVHL